MAIISDLRKNACALRLIVHSHFRWCQAGLGRDGRWWSIVAECCKVSTIATGVIAPCDSYYATNSLKTSQCTCSFRPGMLKLDPKKVLVYVALLPSQNVKLFQTFAMDFLCWMWHGLISKDRLIWSLSKPKVATKFKMLSSLMTGYINTTFAIIDPNTWAMAAGVLAMLLNFSVRHHSEAEDNHETCYFIENTHVWEMMCFTSMQRSLKKIISNKKETQKNVKVQWNKDNKTI